MTLATAIELLEAGRHDEALATLLEAWRETRDEDLANAIETLSARIVATRERPAGKTIKQKDIAWHELAEEPTPSDIGVLAVTVGDVAKGEVLEGRIDALAEIAADPRVAMQLAALVHAMPVPGATGLAAMKRALEVIVKIGDTRTIAKLEECRATPRSNTLGFKAADYVQAELPRCIKALEKKRKLSSCAIALLDRVMQLVAVDATAAVNEAELYDAVYANPDDDGPRLVLADHLQQRGDLRGELIALQLATGEDPRRERRSRELELLRGHGRDWLGPIAPAIRKQGLAYERGFVSSCSVENPGSLAAAILECREWATITKISLGQWPELAPHLPRLMPYLRSASSLPGMIPSHPRLVEVHLDFLRVQDLPQLFAVEAPALRRISVWRSALTDPKHLLPLWSTRLGKALEHVSLDVFEPERFFEQLAHLRGFKLSQELQSPWRYQMTNGELTIETQWQWIDPAALDDLTSRLGGVPSKLFSRVTLAIDKAPNKRLAAELARIAT